MRERYLKGWYNGFGPKDRAGTLATIRAAIADGSICPASSCSVCLRSPASSLGWHSEDYRRPLDAFRICRGCHIRVHARFRHPERWRAFISGLDPAAWFQRLTLDPSSLTRPYDETYPRTLYGSGSSF